MMGHMACRTFGANHEVFGTVRSSYDRAAPLARFLPEERWLSSVDVGQEDTLAGAVRTTRPDAIVNCVGIVKQLPEASEAILSIEINSLLPHRLAHLAASSGAKLVHLSTDCVFSGRVGNYTEDDLPDPSDLYGRSKLLGETRDGGSLTLRTSIVGRQLAMPTSLFEWAISQRGRTITGFDRAIYSGLTTQALARVIEEVLVGHRDICDVWQVASEPISKFRLLQLLNDTLDLGLTIERDEEFHCDRSLDGSRFTAATGIATPTWEVMLEDFRADQVHYGAQGR